MKVPNKPEVLKLLEEKLVCPGCYTDFHCALDQDDPRSIQFFTQGEGRGMLVNCKVCDKSDTRPRMCQLDSLRKELWFCELKHLYAYKAARISSITLTITFGPELNVILNQQRMPDTNMK